MRSGTYSAQQVADMLGVDLWRVKNFILVKSYGLRPTGGKSKFGRFAFADIFKFGLANALVKAGLEAQEVGSAVKAVPQNVWSGWAAPTYAAGDPDSPSPFVLLRHDGRWAVRNAQEVSHTVERALACGAGPDSVFALNLSTLFHDLFWYRIKPYLYGGSKPELLTAETIRHHEELNAEGKIRP